MAFTIRSVALYSTLPTCSSPDCEKDSAFHFPGVDGSEPFTLCKTHGSAFQSSGYPIFLSSTDSPSVEKEVKKAAKKEAKKEKTKKEKRAKYLETLESWKAAAEENLAKGQTGTVIMSSYVASGPGKRFAPAKAGYMQVDIGGVYRLSKWKLLSPSYMKPEELPFLSDGLRTFKNLLNWIRSCEVVKSDLSYTEEVSKDLPLPMEEVMELVRQGKVEVNRPREVLLQFKESVVPVRRRSTKDDPVVFYEVEGVLRTARQFRGDVCALLVEVLNRSPCFPLVQELVAMLQQGVNLNLVGYDARRLREDYTLETFYEDSSRNYFTEAIIYGYLTGAPRPWEESERLEMLPLLLAPISPTCPISAPVPSAPVVESGVVSPVPTPSLSPSYDPSFAGSE